MKSTFLLLIFFSGTLISAEPFPPPPEYEMRRLRVQENIKHFWEATKNFLKDPNVDKTSALELLSQNKNCLLNDMEALRENDGYERFRRKELEELSEIVQRRFHSIQNPKDCKAARKAICEIPSCGFGCRIHHIVLCLTVAYATKRTVIIDPVGVLHRHGDVRYKWEDILLPLSENCTEMPINEPFSKQGKVENEDEAKNLIVGRIPRLDPKPAYLPLKVPADLATRLSLVHGYPGEWWAAQLVKYILRFNPEMQKKIEDRKRKFDISSPIVGIHVRRTDKLIQEAEYHALEEYMEIVEDAFERLEMKNGILKGKRKVFIATDDPQVISEAKEKYPDYDILGDQRVAKEGSNNSNIHEIIGDIEILSESDFVVCTFSSNVCRLAMEMRSSWDANAWEKFYSLDTMYLVFRTEFNRRKYRALMDHDPADENGLKMQKGDLLTDLMEKVFHNGFAMGKNMRTEKEGYFPLFKVQRLVETVDLPTYD